MPEKFSSPEAKESKQVQEVEEKIKNLGLNKDKITEGELKQKLPKLRDSLKNMTEEEYDLDNTTNPIYSFSFEVGKANDEGGWEEKGSVVFSVQSDGKNLELFPAGGQFDYELELLEGENKDD